MKSENKSLDEKMLELADSGHPRADELREKAYAFKEANKNYKGPKDLLGNWARARKLWCECTGEPLV